MTIRHWDAPCKIISINCEKDFSSDAEIISATVQLLAPYGDGSGKKGQELTILINQLNADGGWKEISSAIERLIDQSRKDKIMSAIENSYKLKSLKELVDMYNSMLPKDKRIKKFRDKETAIRRMAETFKEPIAVKDDEKKAVEEPKAKKDSATKQFKIVGRKSQFAGKKIYKLCKDNPRRPGGLAHGYHNWSVYRDGMTYEEYVLAKGLTNQLRWDIEHGFVEVK